MPDDLYVPPVPGRPAIRDVYAIERQVAVPVAGQPDAHRHGAGESGVERGFEAATDESSTRNRRENLAGEWALILAGERRTDRLRLHVFR